MAWGLGGEEIRERAWTSLGEVRAPLYRLRQAALDLQHPEKGPLLRKYVDTVYEELERIEALLGR